MYPILYRKKTRTGFCAGLLLLAVCIRLLCAPLLLRGLRQRLEAAADSGALLRAALWLETGLRAEAARPLSSPARPAETAALDAGRDGQRPSGSLSAESSAPTEAASAAPAPTEAPPPAFSAAEAEAISFRGNCSYEVDKAALLQRPLDWPDTPGPRVLILHSHSCEAYTQSEGHSYSPSANYRTLELANNVTAVGDALAQALRELGVESIHDRTLNDYPDYNAAYNVAREKIERYLAQYPSIVMVLDLHRDALDEPVRETVELDGKTLAPLMLVAGSDESGLRHPHWQDNLACALKLQALGNRDAPGLFKRISFRRQRFNQDLAPGALIVEVGSTENTLPEAEAAMPYLARLVRDLLRCP